MSRAHNYIDEVTERSLAPSLNLRFAGFFLNHAPTARSRQAKPTGTIGEEIACPSRQRCNINPVDLIS